MDNIFEVYHLKSELTIGLFLEADYTERRTFVGQT